MVLNTNNQLMVQTSMTDLYMTSTVIPHPCCQAILVERMCWTCNNSCT